MKSLTKRRKPITSMGLCHKEVEMVSEEKLKHYSKRRFRELIFKS